jgi:predicted RNA-binding protein associated with RNAse of E/G family
MIKVQKRDLAGNVTWEYEGSLLSREPNSVRLEAFFNRPDMPFLNVVFKSGDRFVETFYFDRWYNVFEIFDRDDRSLKGWYCNIGKPAVFEADTVSYVDLALDLWVAADGTQTVLDEEEFEALHLDEATQDRARAALAELRAEFKKKNPSE